MIGEVTDTGTLALYWHGELAGEIPVAPLVDASPMYERPWEPTPAQAAVSADAVATPASIAETVQTLLGTPDLCSRRWIWEQYDHYIRGETMQTPGGDAAVVRIPGGEKALAMTVDCSPRYCFADPEQGGRQAVAECWRNMVATGAKPLALTNNMNFGNPERPRIMGQFVGAIQGMRAAATALDFPVVSGNVSLYNETAGEAILPTPVIGGVGLLKDVGKMATLAFKAEGETILLLGETTGWLGQSIYLRDIAGREEGAPPPVDLEAEARNGAFILSLLDSGLITACHDLSDGGLAVAVAEMALAGRVGAALNRPNGDIPAHAFFFGEDQARYIVTATEPDKVIDLAVSAGVPAAAIGTTGGEKLTFGADDTISLAALRTASEEWLPSYMAVNA